MTAMPDITSREARVRLVAAPVGAQWPYAGTLPGVIAWSVVEGRPVVWNGTQWTNLLPSTVTSTGVAQAGMAALLNAQGKLDLTLMTAVNTSAGVTDAGKLAALDAGGKLAENFMPVRSVALLADQAELVNTNPSGIQLYVQNVAERRMLAASEPGSAPAHFLQPADFSSRVSSLSVDTAGNWVSQGIPAATPSAGSEAAVASSIFGGTASLIQQVPRRRLTSGTTLGSRNAVLLNAPVFIGSSAKAGGFHFSCRFGFNTSQPANTEWFIGFSSAGIATMLEAVGTSAMLFGVGAQSGDTYISAYAKQYAGAAASYTKTTTSGTFLATGSGFYELHLFCPSGAAATMGWQLRRLNGAATAIVSGTFSTAGMTGQTMSPTVHTYLNTAGAAAAIDMVSYYLERDY